MPVFVGGGVLFLNMSSGILNLSVSVQGLGSKDFTNCATSRGPASSTFLWWLEMRGPPQIYMFGPLGSVALMEEVWPCWGKCVTGRWAVRSQELKSVLLQLPVDPDVGL